MTPDAPIEPPHRRRKRYSGTHPRRFSEKYKELDAERFPDAVEKAKARGSTPAGAHWPVMLKEVIAALEPLEGATVLDCTLGWGGHAEELARRVGPAGSVIGIDRDGEELKRAEERLLGRGAKIVARQSNYSVAANVLRELHIAGVGALLADLGVSSMQLDRPERGMSFKMDGPLDMRMDRSKGETAAEWIDRAEEDEIAEVLARFGQEPDARAISRKLFELCTLGRTPKTTGDLVKAVAAAKRLGSDDLRKKDAFSAHPAARTFQALRIVVNGEHEALAQLLRDLPHLVATGGRAALLTFHCGEEAAVEGALRAQVAAGLWRAAPSVPLKPSLEEIRLNPRSRSARLWSVTRA